MALLVKSRGVTPVSWPNSITGPWQSGLLIISHYSRLALLSSLLSTCSWCVVSASTWLALCLSSLSTCSWLCWWAHTLDWLYDSLSSPSTCSCVWVGASTLIGLYDPLSSPRVAGVWLSAIHLIASIDSLSSPSTFSWCVASAYTWLALWLLSPLHL